MIKSKVNQIIVISTLCLVVISMGLFLTAGAYSNALNLVNNSIPEETEPTFNILLKENTYLESSGSVQSNNYSISNTSIKYNISLNPGEFYEFTIAVINQGDIDAKLTSIKSSGLSSNQESLLKYTIYYNKNYYPNNIEELNIGLGSSATEYLRIRVEYPKDETLSQEPLTNLDLMTTLVYNEL